MFDKRVIITRDRHEAALHTFILCRPAVMLFEFNEDLKNRYREQLKASLNARLN